MDQTSRLSYYYTNESLRGIISGLDLSKEDSVLAVAGSGDQAFAFLEFARQVKAVDVSPVQIEFMRKRIEALKAGNYGKFLMAWGIGYNGEIISVKPEEAFLNYFMGERIKYFSQDYPQRLERIRANLENLVIARPANILKVAQRESGFSKVYLSNVFGYNGDESDMEVTRILRNIATNLPTGGLIYLANHGSLNNLSRRFSFLSEDSDLKRNNIQDFNTPIEVDNSLSLSPFLPAELEVDRDLSEVSKTYDKGQWGPAVYRRV